MTCHFCGFTSVLERYVAVSHVSGKPLCTHPYACLSRRPTVPFRHSRFVYRPRWLR